MMTGVLTQPEPLPPFADPDAAMARAARILLPAKRVLPSEAAEVDRYITTGGQSGLWRNSSAPYMVEPMDCTVRRELDAVVFAGPARSSKTAGLIFNPLLHRIVCRPSDTLLVHMSQKDARLFSMRDVDTFIASCPEVKRRLIPSADNLYDKAFTGMNLTIGWPVGSFFAGKDFELMLVTEVDKLPDDIEGEGSIFELAMKRQETYGTRGMSVFESSPRGIVLDPAWQPSSPHEAPPTTGILDFYNQGDRRRWYWRCLHCGEWFEARFADFWWPKDDAGNPQGGINEAAAQVTLPCRVCGVEHRESQKQALNEAGVWLREGETITADGRRGGNPRQSSVASFWLRGPAASFQSWSSMVRKYLRAKEAAERTGKTESLKTIVNVDHGEPFMLPRTEGGDEPLDAQVLRARKEKGWTMGTVPSWVRALALSIDVQGSWFDAKVLGMGPGFETALIDRVQIFASASPGRMVSPGSYPEDWSLLWPLLAKAYPLAEDPAWSLPILTGVVDSGGAVGVTGNAYRFSVEARHRGISSSRLMLLKGDPRVGARRVFVTKVEWRQDGRLLAKGIRILRVSTNDLKDDVAAGLRRETPGPGYLHVPDDAPDDVFDQFTAETRNAKGEWSTAHNNVRNEGFDHLVYARAALLRPPWNWDAIDWTNPPGWALPARQNSLLIPTAAAAPAALQTTTNLAATSPAAPVEPAAPQGRRVRSAGIRI